MLFCPAMSLLYGQGKSVPKNSTDSGLSKIDTLKAAIVTAVIRPQLKGDTIEYNTGHVNLPPNVVVEELLRRLPGLHVDPDGTVSYNGEKISRLLVNGEDIFGNDPTLIIRNFDATKIARVQILDRRTEQAIFTGIDDGTRTKTINLVLKESAKDGYFGKVDAGANTAGDYNADGYVAAFRHKEQFTVIGLASNTGSVSFRSDGGVVGYLYGITDPLGSSAGMGIPRFQGVGLHYANSWNGNADHLMGNYQFSSFYTNPLTITQTFQTQSDSVFGQIQRNESMNQYVQHWLYFTYDWAPNTMTAFKLTIRGNRTNEQNQFASDATSAFNNTLVNTSDRTIRDRMNRKNSGGDLAWRAHIGNQPDRIFSVTASITDISPTVNGYLYSINRFYEPNGQLQSADTVDQRKEIVSHTISASGSINYTEPLWKGTMLGLSYGLSFVGDDPLQVTYDRGDGKYDQLVDSLTSHLKAQTVNQQVMVNLQGKAGHLSYTIGNCWMDYNYRQRDLILDSTIRIRHFDWAPKLLLTYLANQTTNFNFNYNGTTQQPSLSQLAPIKNNNDPLHLTLGNPNLKPGLNQAFTLNFHQLKTWLINVGLDLILANNAISTKIITDSLGRQISQPVNVDGSKTGGVNFSIGRKLLGFEADFHFGGTYVRSVNFVNADLSRNDAYTGGGGFDLNKYVPDKYSLQLYTYFAYFYQVSSINTTVPVGYWTQSHTGAITIYFVKDFEINTNASYSWQQKTGSFSANTTVMIWNAYISRRFLDNKLVTKFQFNNMLNVNAGIRRTNTDNINTQSSTNILGRYWMLIVTYHFDKKFGKKS